MKRKTTTPLRLLALAAVPLALAPGRAAADPLAAGTLPANASGFRPEIVSFGTYTGVADTTTTATGESTAFSSFGTPLLSGSNVAFSANYNAGNGAGIFTGTAGNTGAVAIADYTTIATAQNTVFSGFGSLAISGGNVAFTASFNANSGKGIFTGTVGTRGAVTLADTTTTATNESTAFSSIGTPVISGSNVAFSANYNAGNGAGIFTGTAGNTGAVAIADYTTIATAQNTVFSGFGPLAISGGNVAFTASFNTGQGGGIFTGTAGTKGAVTIADTTTTATGETTAFSGFNTPVISGSNVAFTASYNAGSSTGIFTGTAGTKGAVTLADTTTTATGETTVFSSFGTLAISGSNVAFKASYNAGSGAGIFTGTAGTRGALTLADYTTTAPGRGTFFSFGPLAISGSSVAFTAVSYVTGSSGKNGNGLFLSQNGTLSDIATVGEPLFGSTISSLGFSASGLDGNTLTFEYALANGVSGIDTVVVPEPATWLAGALTLAAATLTLRRRLRVESAAPEAVLLPAPPTPCRRGGVISSRF